MLCFNITEINSQKISAWKLDKCFAIWRAVNRFIGDWWYLEDLCSTLYYVLL